MKKYKNSMFIGLIIFIGLSVIFTYVLINMPSKEEPPILSYSFAKEENKEDDDFIYFKHTVRNMGDKEYQIRFLTQLELEYSILNSDNNFDDFDNDSENNYLDTSLEEPESTAKEGRIVSLKPGETLANELKISSKDLPKGTYEISARLSTENIDTPTFTEYFEVK